MAYFDVGGVTFLELSEDRFENCKEVRFYDDNGAIAIEVINGNCFDRMRIGSKIKHLKSKLKESTDKRIRKKFLNKFSKESDMKEPLLNGCEDANLHS
ncbi:hypothetical protein TorRG33x02_098820 [Trema orientale]|uniref:Uncharacterized protein n=1 Tax=Trema orientale TaxID=63057 RepID=A0A2P5F9F4_TREOI|nr:hypothetical protein TorRG33x02_098820 [Trema orientale]